MSYSLASSYELLLVILACILVFLFAAAAYFDRRRKIMPRANVFSAAYGSEQSPLMMGDDDEDMESLYSGSADMSVQRMGTPQQSVTVRGRRRKNL